MNKSTEEVREEIQLGLQPIMDLMRELNRLIETQESKPKGHLDKYCERIGQSPIFKKD
jgi:hypothetical protein